MALNPMQRKARISFLLGVLLTLIIAGVIIAFLFLQLKNYRDKEAEENSNQVNVLILNQDVKSGEIITEGMFTSSPVYRKIIPANAIIDKTMLENFSLTDKEGNEINLTSKNGVQTLSITKDNETYELKKEDASDSYYIEKNGDKEYIQLATTPIVAKVDMKKNSVITSDSIAKSDEATTDSQRLEEYNMLVLPAQLEDGDYIDIRLAMPTGQDYIVISKKEVSIPEIDGTPSADTIDVKLTEEEIINMNSAIVEAAKISGAKLRVNIYTEAGIQASATPTYVPTRDVMNLISNDPNIIEKSKNELIARFNQNSGDSDSSTKVRSNINSAIQSSGEDGEENFKTQMQESITNSKETREKYLQSLQNTITTTSTSSTNSTSNTTN